MIIAIDLGGTHIKSAIVTSDGKILHQRSQLTHTEKGPDFVLQSIASIISYLTKHFPETVAIGLGVPGVVTGNGVIRVAPNFPNWINIPLKEYLEQRFPLPVAIDNDANVAALAEAELGAGKNQQNFLFITLGTGVGGCIISNGRIFRGANGGAGEVGHIILHETDVPPIGKPSYRAGVLEEYVGRLGIIELAKHYASLSPDSILHTHDDLDVHHISSAVSEGDSAAVECFKRTGELLGAAMSTALNLLDLQLIIAGGGISKSHPLLLQTTLKTIKLRALPTIADDANIRLAHFSNDAGILGAAMLAKQSLKTK
ncbi:MAG: ROK family protein [Ignavibacteriae bacterium]|nr:ROK family protein [Ignavibacteriota bacterium]